MPRHPPAVARVLERVTATARQHEMFAPGDRVLVAVSGGPDSVCLLDLLVRLARAGDNRLVVCHFNHKLRGSDGDEDAQFVVRLAVAAACAIQQPQRLKYLGLGHTE